MDRPKEVSFRPPGLLPQLALPLLKNKSSGLRNFVTTSSRNTTNTRPNNQNHPGTTTIPSHPSLTIAHHPSLPLAIRHHTLPLPAIPHHRPPCLTTPHHPFTILHRRLLFPTSPKQPGTVQRNRLYTPGEHCEWTRALREWIPLSIPRGSAVRRTRTTHRGSFWRGASSKQPLNGIGFAPYFS